MSFHWPGHNISQELLVKWCSLPYSESTWEPAEEVEDTAKAGNPAHPISPQSPETPV